MLACSLTRWANTIPKTDGGYLSYYFHLPGFQTGPCAVGWNHQITMLDNSTLCKAIRRLLLEEWDPLGIGQDQHGQDAYNAYAIQVGRLLVQRHSQEGISKYLHVMATEHMQVKDFSPEHSHAVASKIAEFFKAGCERKVALKYPKQADLDELQQRTQSVRIVNIPYIRAGEEWGERVWKEPDREVLAHFTDPEEVGALFYLLQIKEAGSGGWTLAYLSPTRFEFLPSGELLGVLPEVLQWPARWYGDAWLASHGIADWLNARGLLHILGGDPGLPRLPGGPPEELPEGVEAWFNKP